MSIDIKRARQIARLALLYLAHYADSSQAAEAFRPDDVEWGDDTLELDVCGRRMFDAQAAELTQILSRSRRKGNRRTSEILHLALHLFDPCLEDAEALGLFEDRRVRPPTQAETQAAMEEDLVAFFPPVTAVGCVAWDFEMPDPEEPGEVLQDTVFYEPTCDCWWVLNGLRNHDGIDVLSLRPRLLLR